MDASRIGTREIAVFGGGCFWCTEAVFSMIKGVVSVTPGYAGGDMQNPTYEAVSGGESGHVEVVQIEHDPEQVSFEDLLTVFFASHDPTTLNRQGADVGEQYRSVVFYTSETQKETTRRYIDTINHSNPKGDPVVTTVESLQTFYAAEAYHKNYFQNNRSNPYCMAVINPKLKKVQKQFQELLKGQHKKEE